MHIAAALVAISTVAATGAAVTTSAGADESPRHPAHTSADVRTFAAPRETIGTSGLRRYDDGVSFALQARLEPDHAYTVWWLVFNEPLACSPPGCGLNDLFVDGDPSNGPDAERIAATDAVIAFADGTVARTGSGRAEFRGELGEGEPADAREIVVGRGPTLADGRRAEVHLVVRSHGPAVGAVVADQIGSYAGGCEGFLAHSAVARDTGGCFDAAFSIHRP